jgi:subtilisin family serine protease
LIDIEACWRFQLAEFKDLYAESRDRLTAGFTMNLSGLLIRVPPGAAPAFAAISEAGFSAVGVGFEIEELFSSGGAGQGLGAAAEAGWTWHVARPKTSLAGVNAWDLAHDMASRAGFGVGGETAVFVEPDLVQEWPYENPLVRDGLDFAAGDTCKFNDQVAKLPHVEGIFAWHLGKDFSQLGAARTSAGAALARIAHLDTGYDSNHRALPRNIRRDLQRNFMDDQPADDATDPGARGFLKNPGHGMGTLSILAGNRFRLASNGYDFDDFVGGAPQAEIVPVRVGKSVVQILTSSIAGGISYAADLCADEATRIHVMSMSMGGVASQAWADAVNKAYEAGIVYVAAAGNNFSAGWFGFPTRFIVYPARFRRVIAACGVMADKKPYFGLSFGTMQGNWGPASKMATALSAFTPNMPWAEIGCAGIVDMDGQGTSSATPQIAAAAALYFQTYAAELAEYPEAWMRVEAVRNALFTSANKLGDGGSSEKLGHGILQAAEALKVEPVAEEQLHLTPRDSATLPFLRVLTGLGMAAESNTQRMLALEATQLMQQWDRRDMPNPLESVLADPDAASADISATNRRVFLEALLEHPSASRQLRQHAAEALGDPDSGRVRSERRRKTLKNGPRPKSGPKAPFSVPEPAFRALRGYAIDPSLATNLDTSPIAEITFRVPWEKDLAPGPVGEYLEVIDTDPASKCYYEPVNLNDPKVLAQHGLAPSEGTPQFHQQMVYAVASLTIANFERALGRPALWRPVASAEATSPKDDSVFVPRLRVYPHALREANAYYSPKKIALLFGYFTAAPNAPGEHMAGGMVFTCLSHDIVAHETTHALLDGMSRSFARATNPDVHAFHEGFADIVALFQHFTFPEILRHQIGATRGRIRSQENFLGELAGEFGRGSGLRGALRSAIGKTDQNGVWHPHEPDPSEYSKTSESHARGAILVAAVFDAFLSIYERRTSDLLRLVSGGTGILQPGAIPSDLVQRLADEAAKSAQHVLTMCVRALDYCPPVDITFGEFLRAIITADCDLVEDDDLHYRVAFIEAFRRRGIYPRDVRTLSAESLLWRGPENDEWRPSRELQDGLAILRQYADENMYTASRKGTFHLERRMRLDIHNWLKRHLESSPHAAEDAAYLGLEEGSFEVRTARIAYRSRPDGGMVPQLLLGLLQQRAVAVDDTDADGPQMPFEGGATIIADLRDCRIRYCVRKSSGSAGRRARQQGFAAESAASLRATYFGQLPSDDNAYGGEPFAAMHRGL